jgi:chromosome segregation ATPase
MNTQVNNPSPVDLEETAELPQLPSAFAAPGDPLSATDTWISPAIAKPRVPEQIPSLSPPRARESSAQPAAHPEIEQREAEIGALRSNLASVSESRSQLEHDLGSLGDKLRELEQMLNRKSEELSVYEREVGLRDRRIAELEARTAQLDAALATMGADGAFVRDELQTARADAEAAHARHKALAADITALKSAYAAVCQRMQAAELDLTQWRTRGEHYREALQSLEGRRELYDGMLAERETRLDELERELTERARTSAAREEELRTSLRSEAERVRELDAERSRLEAATATARERIAVLETETRLRETSLQELRTQSGARAEEQSVALRGEKERNADLDAARTRADSTVAAARERIAALEAETRLKDDSLRDLRAQSLARQEELSAALGVEQERNAELDGARARADGAAATARERIAALEAQTRLQEQSLRDLRAQSLAREDELSAALRVEQERITELGELRASTEAAAATARERIAALETQTHLQEQNLRDLRAESLARENELSAALRVEKERNAELAELRARADASTATAQERISALEAETHQQQEHVRELRAQLSTVRDDLAQRNALIERVEAEAASSVAMLGNIQHNLEHIGDGDDLVHLLVRTEGDTGILHLLGRRTTIGRTPDNDLRIDADFISRHHAVVLRAGATTIVEDLNSTNGTYVNGVRVVRRTLKDGDLVTLGKTEFRFSIKPPS